MLAGLAIFPIVFQYGLSPGEGAGLIFVTLPVAFGQMPGGLIIGSLFFLLLFLAAYTTGIAMVEPIVSWLEEHRGASRPVMTVACGVVTGPLIIKTLSQEEYGAYALINSINTIVVYFTSWGLASVFARYVPEFLEKRYVGGLIKLTIGAVAIRMASLIIVLAVLRTRP